MAENGQDLSQQLALEGKKFRDLTEENKTGLLEEILGKLKNDKESGAQAIEQAVNPSELLNTLPQIKEKVAKSPRHLDGQVAAIVDKLKDKEKYPKEEDAAKKLLEQSIMASENGYLGYVARQKYETVATSLNWSKDEDGGTAKVFIDNFLSEKPANADEVRISLTTLNPNSPLEKSLSGTLSAKSFENMMKKQWGIETTKLVEAKEADPDTQIMDGLIGKPNFEQFNSEKDWNDSTGYCIRQLKLVQAELTSHGAEMFQQGQSVLGQLKEVPVITRLTVKDSDFINAWATGKPIQDMPHDSSLTDIGLALRTVYAAQKILRSEPDFPSSINPEDDTYQAMNMLNKATWPEKFVYEPKPRPPHINWESVDLDTAKKGRLGNLIYNYITQNQLPLELRPSLS